MIDQRIKAAAATRAFCKDAIALAAVIPWLMKIPSAISAAYTAAKALPYAGKAISTVAKLPGMAKSWVTAAGPAARAARAAKLAQRAAGTGRNVERAARLARMARRAKLVSTAAKVSRPVTAGLMAMPAATHGLNVLTGYSPAAEEQGQQQPQQLQMGRMNPLLLQYLAMGQEGK